MSQARTLELRLKLAPQEAARLEELASYEGESLEDTVRLVLQYHWSSYERFKVECEEAEREASDNPPQPIASEDDIPW